MSFEPAAAAGFSVGVPMRQEANDNRECLVPKIAALPLPMEMPDVVEEVAMMYAALSGKDLCLAYM